MAGDVDSLSRLPDELLQRVLHFVPVKEAASTAALSRGWRAPLWRSSGAVNLETRVEDFDRYGCYRSDGKKDDEALFFSRRDAFFSMAKAALDAADVPLTRLTLRLDFIGQVDSIHMFLFENSDGLRSPDPDRHVRIANLVSHRAARRVEVLRLAAEDWRTSHAEICSWQQGIFTLSLESLPSETLRVLDITNCRKLVPLPPATTVVFRRLSSLRLCHCTAQLDELQGAINAAPALAVVRLEFVLVTAMQTDYTPATASSPAKALLSCPAASVLALDGCHWKKEDRPWHYNQDNMDVVAVEITAPRLRRFTYKGLLQPFSITPAPPALAHADLHFLLPPHARSHRDRHGAKITYRAPESERERDLVTFWRFLHSCTNAKELKLRVSALEQIAVLSKSRSLELLPMLANVHRLEVQGVHRPAGTTAAVAISNLLRCCPALRDLRINLTAESELEDRFLARNDRHKSIHGLSCYRRSARPTVSPAGTAADLNYEDVPKIPSLTRRSFDCLQSTMKSVSLQFRLEDANCFAVGLLKFFAENAMVLEEMYIDSGNKKVREHLTHKVKRWFADSSTKRKPGASRFVVLPLKRL